MSQESDLQNLHAQAYTAFQQGRPTFVARLKSSQWGTPAGQLGGWMDSIDAVESVGWVLQHWSSSVDAGGTFNAFPVFRRRLANSEGWTPQDRP